VGSRRDKTSKLIFALVGISEALTFTLTTLPYNTIQYNIRLFDGVIVSQMSQTQLDLQ